MSVSALPSSPSFEELRIEDYLKAYSTTGRPPPPCPLEPSTPNARAALGLPPLFQAIPVDVSGSGSGSGLAGGDLSALGSIDQTIRDPADLPAFHAFEVFHATHGEEKYQNVVAQSALSHFSPEELRHYAYRLGNIYMEPPSLLGETSTSTTAFPPTHPFLSSPALASAPTPAHPFYANDGPSTAYITVPTASAGTPDRLMSICASPRFDKHCFEELRVSYLLAGRELDSSEILGPAVSAVPPAPAPASSLFSRPRGDAFSFSKPLRSF
ncbi:hypothetical protein BV22DRAFT_1039664 [Leucogyrophana mollusca]|uniref:Uncharacterized protein n=1 Tax=Leucogyrophana mollusca TaxID=85980 RepID=A0ACB8B772_9AGAM|nr:hypothetical protein BV22DRAFT_1039664 [Leucogyrophana mollusca]